MIKASTVNGRCFFIVKLVPFKINLSSRFKLKNLVNLIFSNRMKTKTAAAVIVFQRLSQKTISFMKMDTAEHLTPMPH